MNWGDDSSTLRLNPRWPADEAARLRSLAHDVGLKGHVWIATSGSTGAAKLVALSKAAVLASARAVNEFLESSARDTWCRALPAFHVGGLGIEARASLSGARVEELELWDAIKFIDLCERSHVTLSALVPAQVSDLVRAGRSAPRGLRAIVVGGGRLSPELYAAARGRGWPVLPSFGMTEAASQVATAPLSSLVAAEEPRLVMLPHAEARREADGRLAFRGASLLTGYAWADGAGQTCFADPKKEGWFVSEDLGEAFADPAGRRIEVQGRGGEFLKIGGESVALPRLDAILEAVLGAAPHRGDAALAAVPDARLGHVIHLAVTEAAEAETLRAAFNARVLPFERARAVHVVREIPRTPLRKLRRAELALTFARSPLS